jgi:hypothetical protein
VQPQHDAVRHIVAFRYKPEAAEDQIKTLRDAFRALQTRIPGIVAMEDGVNNSPEGKNHGFTHVFLLTFEDAAARDAYLPHPEHAQFGRLLRQLAIVEDAFVLDFTPADSHSDGSRLS